MRLGRLALITASISASTTSSAAALFSNNAKRAFHSTMSSASSLFEFTVKDASVRAMRLDVACMHVCEFAWPLGRLCLAARGIASNDAGSLPRCILAS